MAKELEVNSFSTKKCNWPQRKLVNGINRRASGNNPINAQIFVARIDWCRGGLPAIRHHIGRLAPGAACFAFSAFFRCELSA